MKKIIWIVLAGALVSGPLAQAAPTSEQIRKATVEYLHKGAADEGIDKFTAYLGRRVSSTARVPSRELEVLATAAECTELLKLSQQHRLSQDGLVWILGSDHRLHRFTVTALQHADGKIGRWGDKYADIEYNHDRLSTSRFSWDEGTYMLASIQKLGGICVDQAYRNNGDTEDAEQLELKINHLRNS